MLTRLPYEFSSYPLLGVACDAGKRWYALVVSAVIASNAASKYKHCGCCQAGQQGGCEATAPATVVKLMDQSVPFAANAEPLAAQPGAGAPDVADAALVPSLAHPVVPVPAAADAAAPAMAEEPALAPAAAANPHALGLEPALALAPAAAAGAAGPVPAGELEPPGVVQPQAPAAGGRVLQALRGESLIELNAGILIVRNWRELKWAAGFDPGYLYSSATSA